MNQRHTSDFAYRLDFHRLMALLREAGDPLRAAVFGSITDTNEASWAHAQAAGFDVQVVERDGDYEPLVRQLVADRFHVTLLFWAHASRELQRPASHFYALDPYIAELALG